MYADKTKVQIFLQTSVNKWSVKVKVLLRRGVEGILKTLVSDLLLGILFNFMVIFIILIHGDENHATY